MDDGQESWHNYLFFKSVAQSYNGSVDITEYQALIVFSTMI